MFIAFTDLFFITITLFYTNSKIVPSLKNYIIRYSIRPTICLTQSFSAKSSMVNAEAASLGEIAFDTLRSPDDSSRHSCICASFILLSCNPKTPGRLSLKCTLYSTQLYRLCEYPNSCAGQHL